MNAVHADLGALSAMVRRGFEKLSQIRHEQTRARVGRSGNAANTIVVVGVYLAPNIDEALAEGDTRFAVNLAEVAMIDSSGIGLLVKSLTSTKQRGGSLKLVSPSNFAIKTLKLVGVLNLFEVFDSDDKAVESFN